MLLCRETFSPANPGDKRLIPLFDGFTERAQAELPFVGGENIVAPVEKVGNEAGTVQPLQPAGIFHRAERTGIRGVKRVIVPRQQKPDVPRSHCREVVAEIVGLQPDHARQPPRNGRERMPACRSVAERDKLIEQLFAFRCPLRSGIAVEVRRVFRVPDRHDVVRGPDELRPAVARKRRDVRKPPFDE